MVTAPRPRRRRVLVRVRDVELRRVVAEMLRERGVDATEDVDVDAGPCRVEGPAWDVVLVDVRFAPRDVQIAADVLAVDPRTRDAPIVALDPTGTTGRLPTVAATLHRLSSIEDLVRAIDDAARLRAERA